MQGDRSIKCQRAHQELINTHLHPLVQALGKIRVQYLPKDTSSWRLEMIEPPTFWVDDPLYLLSCGNPSIENTVLTKVRGDNFNFQLYFFLQISFPLSLFKICHLLSDLLDVQISFISACKMFRFLMVKKKEKRKHLDPLLKGKH